MTTFASTIDTAPTDIAALRAALLAGTAPAVLLDSEAIPAALVPKDMTVDSLEHLLPAPTRCRRKFATDNLDDFLTYCANEVPEGSKNPHILYQDQPPQAVAHLDFGSGDAPAWDQHIAVWTPRESPALEALRALVGRLLDQDTLTNYIDDWADYLDFERDGTPISVPAARAAIADLTAETIKTLRNKTGEFSRERSALEKISIAPTAPNRMTLTCHIWVGFSIHQVQVRISAADSATLALRLQLIAWPTHLDNLTSELRERLDDDTSPIVVLSGRI